MISDSINKVPLLITIENNEKSFYVLNRTVNGQLLTFIPAATKGLMEDSQTHSTWQLNGICTAGPLQGSHLEHVQAYQEFWHSWKNFHPTTTTYKN